MDDAKPISITFAVADHPWRDVETDAAVRVAMTVIRAGKLGGLLIAVADDPTAQVVSESRGLINPDLTTGVAAAALDPLESNRDMCYMGVKLAGDGFRLTRDERDVLVARGVPPVLMPRLVAGSDITRRLQHRFVIDVYGMSEAQLRKEQPILYQHLIQTVQTERQQLKRRSYRDLWWLFAEPRPNMRRALRGLRRAIATSEVSKHATFVFFDLEETQFDGSAIVISHDDALVLGWLSSTPHALWKLRTGGRMGVGNDPRYQSFRVFDPFPFPADVSEPLQARIRAEAEALDVLRKRVLAEHTDLTLTKLYNVLEALREGRALTAAERDIHDRGLVTLIRQHHDAIDEGVADAYGWGDEHRAGTLDEEMILTRLVALNKERAAEEGRGLVRYLRPEFQDPGFRAPVATTLDLGEAAAAPVSNIIPWPATLPEQVGAVQSILAAAPTPLGAGDIARSFKGKRAATVRPVLDALAGLGMARRLNDGRYAA